MTNTAADIPANSPPDWESHPADLLCPLCRYNLRYLTTARCPECGFTFRWQELLDAEKNRHKYIFEDGRGRNFKSFWRTYWRTCRPRRFWSDVNPAQPVQLFRLMLYWAVTTGVVFLAMSAPRVVSLAQAASEIMQLRAGFVPVQNKPGNFQWPGLTGTYTATDIDEMYPLPWQWRFWRQAISSPLYRNPSYSQLGFGFAVIFLLWPWLTLIAMLIFRVSMRKAKIRLVQLVRTAIYSCDFGLFLALGFLVLLMADPHLVTGWDLALGELFCATVTAYRLTIAFKQYLRVHLPFETVLASQIISLLVMFLLLLPVADFSRQV